MKNLLKTKKVIQKIIDLPWESYKPVNIAYLNIATAQEFGQSLRMASDVFPKNENVKALIKGELNTANLKYLNYNRIGDHEDFLNHFFIEYGLFFHIEKKLEKAVDKYFKEMSKLSKEHRVMTIFSRENELPEIFRKIVNSHDWESQHNLLFYKTYLSDHIYLDSQEGGHAHLTEDIMEFDDDVLENYYKLRLEFYKSLQ